MAYLQHLYQRRPHVLTPKTLPEYHKISVKSDWEITLEIISLAVNFVNFIPQTHIANQFFVLSAINYAFRFFALLHKYPARIIPRRILFIYTHKSFSILSQMLFTESAIFAISLFAKPSQRLIRAESLSTAAIRR